MRAQTAETLRRLKSALPGLAAAALFAGAALLLSGPRTVWGNPTGEVPLELPDELGPWRAERVYYCTSNQCARSWLQSQLPEEPAACPECGAALAGISLGEINLLPDATPIFRRVYRRAGHPDIMATVVFSGIERRSIHRPQVCLVGQGNRILDEYTRPTRASPRRMRCHSARRSPSESALCNTATQLPKRAAKRWIVCGVRAISGTRTMAPFPFASAAAMAWR